MSTRSRHCLWSRHCLCPRNGQSIIWVFFHSHFLLTPGDSKGHFPLWSLQIKKKNGNSALGRCLEGFDFRAGQMPRAIWWIWRIRLPNKSYFVHTIAGGVPWQFGDFFFPFDIGPHWGGWVTGALSPVLEAHQSLFKHQSLCHLLVLPPPPSEPQQGWSCPVLWEEDSQTQWELEGYPGYQYK